MVRNTDEEEIREHGFERFIRGHIENTHMAFNSKFFEEHQDVVKALSDALWKRQTSPEQHRYHFDARRTWDTLGNAPKVKVPALILCGAGDDVNRGGSTPVGTARKLGELVPGCELALVPNVKHMTFWDGDGALHTLQEFLGAASDRVISAKTNQEYHTSIPARAGVVKELSWEIGNEKNRKCFKSTRRRSADVFLLVDCNGPRPTGQSGDR